MGVSSDLIFTARLHELIQNKVLIVLIGFE